MGSENTVGSVSLDLVIENTVAKQLETIAKQAKQPAEAAFQKIGQTIEKAVTPNAQSVQKAVQNTLEKAVKQAKPKPIQFDVATDDTELLQQKLNNVYAQMGAVEEKLRKAENAFNLTDDSDIKTLNALDAEMTALQSKLISLQSTANATEKKLMDVMNTPAKAAEKATEQARRAAEKAAQDAQKAFERSYNQIIRQAQNASAQAQKWALQAERAQSKSASRAAKHAEKAYNKQAKACRTYANKYAAAQSDSSEKAARAMEKAQKRAQKAAQKASAAGAKAAKKMAADSASGGSKMSGAFGKFGKAIKGSLKAVFVTAVLYKFFNAFKSQMTGAMQQNKQFAKSLNAIKANLSVAFTPIVEAVMPLITRLAQGLAMITKYIATFIAAIFGKTYKQAVNSTKKLQTQAKKAQASTSRDFDELHNVEKSDSDGESDSDGVNYDALDTSQLNTGPMQKFQEILDKIKGTIEKVKPAFTDFYEKGVKPIVTWIGEKLKDAFAFLGEQLGKVGDWFVDHKDTFSRLGESLGKLWEFVEPILNAAWDTLKDLLSGLFDSVLAGVGTLFDTLPDVIDFITALFTGDWEAMKESGKNIILGLWNGIKEQWELFKERLSNLIDGLINIVKALFGIHSPSTVFSDIGDNLIAGLWEGLKERWEAFKENLGYLIQHLTEGIKAKFNKIKNTVLSMLDSLKTALKTKLDGIWDSFKGFINKILGGVEKMINKPVEALNRFIAKLNSLSGKEAVVPLQNNTGWMKDLCDMLGTTIAGVLIPILQTVSGKQDNTSSEAVLNINGERFVKILIPLLAKHKQELKTAMEGRN